jgi:RimJ/RimL family protein N-acetyltransferase
VSRVVGIGPVVLAGDLVVLEPLTPSHHDELVSAVSDGRLWELWYTSVPSPEAMAGAIEALLAEQGAGTRLPFTVRRASGPVVGMTTYLNIEAEVPRLEIGSTWTAASAQRSGVNAESKLLLLGHAFETLGCLAVEFRTHWHNRQSRAAIERLGAKQDGVLRAHRRMPDGSLRDTVVYSITAAEWPAVRNGLRARLSRSG